MPPSERGGETDTLDDPRVRRLVEADRDYERAREHACEGVTELEQHHEQKHRDRGIPRQEFAERFEGGREHAAQGVTARLAGPQICRRVGLARHERGKQTDRYERGGSDVTPGPNLVARDAKQLEPGHERDHAGTGNEHPDAIGEHVGRHTGGLFARIEAFHAECVDHDVLRRGGGRNHDGRERERERRGDRIEESEKNDRRREHELAEDEPTAAPSKRA